MEGTLQRHRPTEGRGIREGAIIVVVVVVVDGDNNDKGTGRQVQGQGMERPSLLSDLLPRWTEDDQGNRGGRGQRNPPLGSRHRRGVGDLNPMLASLTWMLFTTTVPLTVGVVPGRLNRQIIYLEDTAIPSQFASSCWCR